MDYGKTKYTDEDLLYFEYIKEKAYIDPKLEIEHPPTALTMGRYRMGKNEYPVPIGTYGNFSFIQAPPKTNKTFFVSLLSAAYLKGESEYTGIMKGQRGDKDLIHFDTEQGSFHSQRVFRRVLDMIEVEDSPNYKTFALRTFSYKDRLAFIDYYLNQNKDTIGMVIIDGIADLISDVNNLEESNMLVQHLMTWSANINCHIVVVIHSNFGTDKPTGHLGSFLEKKTETQIQLERNTVNEGHITVKCKRSRNFGFDSFSFKVDERGFPVVIGDTYNILEGIDYNKKK